MKIIRFSTSILISLALIPAFFSVAFGAIALDTTASGSTTVGNLSQTESI
jgi:hypothetical protein